MADSLATAFYNTMTRTNKTVGNSHFYPSSWVSLLVNGQRTTANLAAAIRFHISGTTHHRFLQQKTKGWQSDSVWCSIDFEAFGGAYKTLSTSARTNICKLVHGWMNTGEQRAKLNPSASSCCPRCGEVSENQEHFCGVMLPVQHPLDTTP